MDKKIKKEEYLIKQKGFCYDTQNACFDVYQYKIAVNAKNMHKHSLNIKNLIKQIRTPHQYQILYDLSDDISNLIMDFKENYDSQNVAIIIPNICEFYASNIIEDYRELGPSTRNLPMMRYLFNIGKVLSLFGSIARRPIRNLKYCNKQINVVIKRSKTNNTKINKLDAKIQKQDMIDPQLREKQRMEDDRWANTMAAENDNQVDIMANVERNAMAQKKYFIYIKGSAQPLKNKSAYGYEIFDKVNGQSRHETKSFYGGTANREYLLSIIKALERIINYHPNHIFCDRFTIVSSSNFIINDLSNDIYPMVSEFVKRLSTSHSLPNKPLISYFVNCPAKGPLLIKIACLMLHFTNLHVSRLSDKNNSHDKKLRYITNKTLNTEIPITQKFHIPDISDSERKDLILHYSNLNS